MVKKYCGKQKIKSAVSIKQKPVKIKPIKSNVKNISLTVAKQIGDFAFGDNFIDVVELPNKNKKFSVKPGTPKEQIDWFKKVTPLRNWSEWEIEFVMVKEYFGLNTKNIKTLNKLVIPLRNLGNRVS